VFKAPIALRSGKEWVSDWTGGWVGPRRGVDFSRTEKISCLHQDSKSGPPSLIAIPTTLSNI